MNVLRIIKFIFMLLLLLFFTLVAVTNKDPVSLKLLPFFSERVTLPPLPLSFVLFMAFLLGILIVGFYAVFEMLKQNFKISKLKKQNSLLEKEISNLRKEPLVLGSESQTQEGDEENSAYKSYDDLEGSEETLVK